MLSNAWISIGLGAFIGYSILGSILDAQASRKKKDDDDDVDTAS
jgi:hypothetical protein